MDNTAYERLHLWMLIPFSIAMLGFIPSYWSQFTSATIGWHLHGLSATLWFLLLVVQPFIYTKGNIQLHRKVGILAILVAGFVAASALAVIRGHIQDLDPEFDAIYDYRYSLSLTDLVYVAGFLLSVVMAVVHSKRLSWHSRWMVTSVFWALSPATDRLVYWVFDLLDLTALPWFDFEAQFLISHVFLSAVLLSIMIIDRKAGKASAIPFGLVLVSQLLSPLILVELKDSTQLASWFENLYRLPY